MVLMLVTKHLSIQTSVRKFVKMTYLVTGCATKRTTILKMTPLHIQQDVSKFVKLIYLVTGCVTNYLMTQKKKIQIKFY